MTVLDPSPSRRRSTSSRMPAVDVRDVEVALDARRSSISPSVTVAELELGVDLGTSSSEVVGHLIARRRSGRATASQLVSGPGTARRRRARSRARPPLEVRSSTSRRARSRAVRVVARRSSRRPADRPPGSRPTRPGHDSNRAEDVVDDDAGLRERSGRSDSSRSIGSRAGPPRDPGWKRPGRALAMQSHSKRSSFRFSCLGSPFASSKRSPHGLVELVPARGAVRPPRGPCSTVDSGSRTSSRVICSKGELLDEAACSEQPRLHSRAPRCADASASIAASRTLTFGIAGARGRSRASSTRCRRPLGAPGRALTPRRRSLADEWVRRERPTFSADFGQLRRGGRGSSAPAPSPRSGQTQSRGRGPKRSVAAAAAI